MMIIIRIRQWWGHRFAADVPEDVKQASIRIDAAERRVQIVKAELRGLKRDLGIARDLLSP